MGAFDLASAVERQGLPYIVNFLESRKWIVRFALFGEGRQALKLQRRHGDVTINTTKGRTLIGDFKVETRTTGNLFLETWSNRDELIRGWFLSREFDTLFYLFLDTLTIHVADMDRLQGWLIGRGWDRSLMPDYLEVYQDKYEQRNKTFGVLVPIKDLRHNAGLKSWRFGDAGWQETGDSGPPSENDAA